MSNSVESWMTVSIPKTLFFLSLHCLRRLNICCLIFHKMFKKKVFGIREYLVQFLKLFYPANCDTVGNRVKKIIGCFFGNPGAFLWPHDA